MKDSVLIVDDDPAMWPLWDQLRENYAVSTAVSGEEAIGIFTAVIPDTVIIELHLRDMTGINILMRLKELEPDIGVVILTAHGNIEVAVEAMKLGADNFLTKPIEFKTMDAILKKSIQKAKLTRTYRRLRHRYENRQGLPEGEQLILDEDTMRDVDIAARNNTTTILITGPTGAGKSVIAGLIHRQSARRDQPFVDINCAGLSETLLESELFGHERGAFTDAKTAKRGLMEVADGGTLFLDEIGELPRPLQAKFLKAIETKSFRRVGGTRNIEVELRIIAATNVNLNELVRQGQFRQDLFYRLNVLPIHMKSLAERIEDIPKLVMLYLQNHAHRLNRTANIISDEAVAALSAYSWPGNIRELRNVIDRAAIICGAEGITLRDLPVELQQRPRLPSFSQNTEIVSLHEAERRAIERTLKFTENNKAAAARILGIDVKTLRRKLHEYRQQDQSSS
ncbi:MAG: sigma-54 dependent transcriptional regulator [Myxococcota bacterium]